MKRLRCWLVGHDWKRDDFFQTGGTVMGWNFRTLYNEWARSEVCACCGKKQVSAGYYVPGDVAKSKEKA